MKNKTLIIILVFQFVIMTITKGQKYLIENKDIKVIFNIEKNNDELKIGTTIVNKLNEEIYIKNLKYQNFTLPNNDSEYVNCVIVESGVFLLHLPSYNIKPCLQKLNSKDTIYSINLFKVVENLDNTKYVIFYIDYLCPENYKGKNYKKIIKNIELHPETLSNEQKLYTINKDIYGQYCNYIILRTPLSSEVNK